MAITRTRTNTTTERPRNRQHEEVHVEDQTDLSSMVRRLQGASIGYVPTPHRRGHDPSTGECITTRGAKAYSTTFEIPKAPMLVFGKTHTQSINTMGKQLQQFKNPFVPDIMEATFPYN
ncbi:hypothetical protein JHK87_042287 [Glycine soja]|nr:hypothetical protein JHK87_042287 [Glycine soja]